MYVNLYEGCTFIEKGTREEDDTCDQYMTKGEGASDVTKEGGVTLQFCICNNFGMYIVVSVQNVWF